MHYTTNDIDIYILTHNRADYLKTSINSLLNQTVKINKITVLDNESTDNTQEIVESFAPHGVNYIKTYGFLGNFLKAQEIASRKYCMLFHDDDLLHPQYIEKALFFLNKYEDISLIVSRYQTFIDNDIPLFNDEMSLTHYLFNSQKDFARQMYCFEHIAYGSAIYRTKDFKITSLEYEKFSKFNDWPFMVKLSYYGKSVLLDEKTSILAREHPGQDSSTFQNFPTLQQIVNWDKFFFDAMNYKKAPYFFKRYLHARAYRFCMGKYAIALPLEYKEDNSFDDLIVVAQSVGLKIEEKKIKFISKKLLKIYLEYLKNKNVCVYKYE